MELIYLESAGGIATFSATNTAGADQTNELFAVSTEYVQSSY